MADSTEYGWVFTTSDTKDNLYQNNRDYYGDKTWEKLYNQATIGAQKSTAQAQSIYENSLLEAYLSAENSKSAIEQTNLFGSAKDAQLTNINDAMNEAYASYQNNLYSQEQAIAEKYQQTITDIDTALTTQATNYNAFASSAYDYLTYLYDEYEAAEDVDNIFVHDDLWSRYTTTEKDENGKDVRRLKTWDELINRGAKDEKGEYIGLFDEQGNLTIKGSEFYDFMLNEISSTGLGDKYKHGKGYWEWLNETNPELKEWAESYNPYDYTTAGTNVGSFKEDVGLLSTDETYQFMERFGGYTSTEAKATYKEFTDEINSLMSIAANKGKDKGKDIINSALSLSNKLQTYCNDLGITLSADQWNAINKTLTSLYSGSATSAEMADNWFNKTFARTGEWAATGGLLGAGMGFVAGGALGGAAGSVLPVLGTTAGGAAGAGAGAVTFGGVGAAAGAIVGFIDGIIESSIAVENQRKTNQQAAIDATNLLNKTIVYLTDYANKQHSTINSQYKQRYNLK